MQCHCRIEQRPTAMRLEENAACRQDRKEQFQLLRVRTTHADTSLVMPMPLERTLRVARWSNYLVHRECWYEQDCISSRLRVLARDSSDACPQISLATIPQRNQPSWCNRWRSVRVDCLLRLVERVRRRCSRDDECRSTTLRPHRNQVDVILRITDEYPRRTDFQLPRSFERLSVPMKFDLLTSHERTNEEMLSVLISR